MELTGGDWLFIGASACALTAAYCCLRSWASGTAAGEGAAARPAGGGGGGDPAAKKRSWLLSLLTSPVLIASGCTSVPGLIRSGFSGSFVTSHSPWHRRSMLFFLSFLVSDLVVGTADYPQEVRRSPPRARARAPPLATLRRRERGRPGPRARAGAHPPADPPPPGAHLASAG